MLLYTNRSQYEDGEGHCKRSRYLQYHSGPTGYGIRLKAEAMPLATGTYIHEPISVMATHARQGSLDDNAVREAIASARTNYHDVIEVRGLRGFENDPGQKLVVTEQTGIIEALSWVWAMNVLPWLLETYNIISVEIEEEYVADCTCGLGDGVGDFTQHTDRDCDGIGMQGRADLILEYKGSPGSYSYHELKTVAQTGERWETQWETKLQFAIGSIGAERRLGRPIAENWVHGLIKGRRYKPKGWEHKIQASHLIYPYCKLGNPPMTEDEWQPFWEWVDTTGKNRRLGKGWSRRPVWDAAYPVEAPMTQVEYWVKLLTPEQRGEALCLIGPLNRQDAIIEGFKDDVIGVERGWQNTLWELYEAADALGPAYWSQPDFQKLLNRLVPRSWECRRYGYEHRCQFENVCLFHEGWDRIFDDGGRYIPRRPHHDAELEQAIARGLLPKTDALYDEPEVD